MDVNTWAGSGPILYLVVVLALLAESTIVVGLFAPGVSALVLAAFVSGTGGLSPLAVWVLGFVSVVVGDNLGYGVGVLARQSDRVATLLRKAGVGDARHRQKLTALSVFYQFPVVTRAPLPVYWGTISLGWWRFLTLNAVGSLLFVSALFLPGYLVGRAAGSLDDAQHFAVVVQYIFLGLAVVWIAVLLRRYFKWRRNSRASPESAAPLDERELD